MLLATAAGYIVARLIQADQIGFLALDYKLEAAQRLIDGQTLYPTSGPEFGDYPYPPIWAIVTTPLLALPHVVAQYTAGIPVPLRSWQRSGSSGSATPGATQSCSSLRRLRSSRQSGIQPRSSRFW